MIAAAFLTGFFGSLHCVGMCGPIALALPLPRQKKLGGVLFYNAGRVLTYSLLGMFFGLVGSSFILIGWQRAFSIFLGAAILLVLLLPRLGKAFSKSYLESAWASWVRKKLQQQFIRRTYASSFISGLLNGLLPCGLVYVAVAGALVSASSLDGAFYMAVFGVGTLPAMLLINLAPRLLFNRRPASGWIIPSISIAASVILLYRGLWLHVPFSEAASRVGEGIMTICR